MADGVFHNSSLFIGFLWLKHSSFLSTEAFERLHFGAWGMISVGPHKAVGPHKKGFMAVCVCVCVCLWLCVRVRVCVCARHLIEC